MHRFVFVSFCFGLLSIGQFTNDLIYAQTLVPKALVHSIVLSAAIDMDGFLGCYLDQNARILAEKMTTSTSMTVGSCRKTCTDLNFKYYGVENSSQCFCGYELINAKRTSDGDCLRPCAGDQTQACGGDWRIAIYENFQYIPSSIVRKDFLGCYLDRKSRALKSHATISTSMTVDSCRKTCTDLKFKYYGVEYGKQCFCGNKLINVKKMEDDDCLRPCTGDRTQACGGDWRLAIYENPQYKPNAIVRKDFLGCYLDRNGQTLNEKMVTSTTMTVDSCRKTCTDLNFQYYGVEYSSQCFCGNKLTVNRELNENDCLRLCAGDKTQACGGVRRLALYKNPQYIPNFLGCYLDQEARTLNGKMTTSTSMTVDSCRKTCTDLNFKYYGVEYSSQCFCGNKLPKVKRMRNADCLSSCAGDQRQACGGDWRIAVYRNP